jgi:MFS family permease
MDTMGAVVGPGLALLLLGLFKNDYRMIFWLSIIPAAAAVMVIVVFITDMPGRLSSVTTRPRLSLKYFGWQVKFFIMIATLFALGNSSDVFLILRAGQIGVPTALVPAVYLVFNLVYSLSAIPAGIAADRFGKKKMILLGFLLFALVYTGFAAVQRPLAVWVLFALYGVYMGLTEGVQKAFLASIIPPDYKATAFGIYATMVGLAMFPASLIGGWLWDRISPAATFYFGAGTAMLCAALFSIFIVMKSGEDTREP